MTEDPHKHLPMLIHLPVLARALTLIVESPLLTLTDKAREALTAMPSGQQEKLVAALETVRLSLSDTNSAFPETQKFLVLRGLTHVDQLDAQGRKELKTHLEQVLIDLLPDSP